MANKEKGEVELKNGDDTYILLFDHNALCEFEGKTGKNAISVLSGEDISMTDLRAMFWAGLQEKHPEITVRDAGKLLTQVGDEKLFEALNAASPEPEKSEPKSGNSQAGKTKKKPAPKK